MLHKINPDDLDMASSSGYMDVSSNVFQVRSKSYLHDKTKIAGSMPPILNVDSVYFYKDSSSNVSTLIDQLAQETTTKRLLLHIILPSNNHFILVASETSGIKNNLWNKYFQGTIDRTHRLKLITDITNGSYLLRKMVRPAVLDKVLTCNVTLTNNCLLYKADISTSMIASKVYGMINYVLKTLIINIALVIECQNEKELPEKILTCCQLRRIQAQKNEESI